jgi:cell wall-associated NlpC family hydrolase
VTFLYHTDPTAPGYNSHVAIYLGNGMMIQAPQPGQTPAPALSSWAKTADEVLDSLAAYCRQTNGSEH